MPFDVGLSAALALRSASPVRRWQIGRQTLIQGDCLRERQTLGSGSIDVIVTCPPYNIGVAYRSYDDGRPRQAYLEWLTKVGRQLRRVLKDDGSFFLNVGSTNTNPWVSFDVAAAFRGCSHGRNAIVWAKSVGIGPDTFGHFKPINSRRFLNHTHETILNGTPTAAQQLGCCGIGFEEDAAYVAKACERLGDIQQPCGGSRCPADSNANIPY
jgi:site-specific DNA-methyltransferase (adenine-specific)